MKTFPSAKAAHEANNAVLLAARKLAEEHGVLMAIVVCGHVQGSPKAIVGVEYTRDSDPSPLVQIMAISAGTLGAEAHKAMKASAKRATEFGEERSDELLDRDRVGDEDMEKTDG